MRRTCAGLLALLATALVAPSALAQAISRPADERPSIDDVQEQKGEAPLVLPPIPPPPRAPLSTGLQVEVREIRVEGSTVFSAEQLDEATRPFVGRSLASDELQVLLDSITDLYISEGYVSSGATLPDQDLEGGVLVVRAVEAKLVDVVVEGARWYRPSYLRRRLLASVPAPVNVHRLEAELQVLRQERGVDRLGAELRPGPRAGEDVLMLLIEEPLPFRVAGQVANDNPPGIGSVQGRAFISEENLVGFGDALRTEFQFAEGLLAQEVRYAIPVTPWDTEIGVHFRHSRAEVVRSPFDVGDITAETFSGGFGVRQPVVRTPSTRLALQVIAERRHSKTDLDDDPFEFLEGANNGKSDVSVLRFMVDGSWRSETDVVAARAVMTWGLGALGATDSSRNGLGEKSPEGRFEAWLVQAQWAHRLPEWLLETQLVMRGDLQLTGDRLLTLEQIAIGGVQTVRGYRENRLIRDNAVILSGELRIPLLRGRLGANQLQVVPFFDWGTGWNEGPTPSPKTIYSWGLGLRYGFSERVSAYGYWADSLNEQGPNVGGNIQEHGFHLGLRFEVF